MEFCPKCSSIMLATGASSTCAQCGHKKKGKIDMTIKEKIDSNNEVAIVDKKKESANPVTDYKCKKCGNKKAYFWLQQMRAGDEPESKFYQCTKCENTVRVDD
jgi:DNA-directed RNA polymerase subunit M